MSCLGRAAVPVKRVWLGLSARLGLRRTTGLSARLGLRRTTGLGELHKEVRTCEYHDVHVMWEMLSTMDAHPPRAARKTRRRSKAAAAAAWRRLVSYCCAF